MDSATIEDGHDVNANPDEPKLEEGIPPVKVTKEQAIDLARDLYGFEVTNIKQLNGYDDRNYHIHINNNSRSRYSSHSPADSDDINCEHGYVLKIINVVDSKWPQAVDMHIHAMFRLNENGITAPVPVKNRDGKYFSEETLPELDEQGNVKDGPPNRHTVRLSTFIPGKILFEHPDPSLELFREVGRLVADVGVALNGLDHHEVFTHPERGTVWFMVNHHWLKDYIYATRCPKRRQFLRDIVEHFEQEVLARKEQLTPAIIHNDINEQNILIREKEDCSTTDTSEKYEICGLLDFNDINKAYKVFDIAIAMMYMMTVAKSVDFIDVGGAVLKGYLEKTDLNEADSAALCYCVAMRYAVSLGMGEHGISLSPDNAYLVTTAESGWDQMEKLWTMPTEELRKRWGL